MLDLDTRLNNEITSSVLVMDGNVEVESVVEEDDGNVFGDSFINEDSSDVDGEMKKMRDEEDGESDGGVVVKKGESGRKRKVVGSSEKVEVENDRVRVNGRVLRSSVVMSGSIQVDENRLNESAVGFKRQMEAECFDPTELNKEVDEKSQVMARLNKKQKLQVEIGVSGKILVENDVEEVDESVLLIGKGQKKQKCRGRPPKTQGMKNSIVGADRRRMEQQLVRHQIVSMIMKAGWTIEHRPRQNGQYLDTVYIDMQGKTHWSAPNAYFTLKKKIEKGVACNEEVSAFTSIPIEELSVLLRPVSKVRSNKNMKEKNGKNACKAEIIITGVAQPKKHKKKLDKENKETKATQTPKVTGNDRQGRKPCLLARSTSKGVESRQCRFCDIQGEAETFVVADRFQCYHAS